MLIFPAIDLLQGQAVRLLKGNYDQKTIYSDDPLEVAMKFKSEGAKTIHLVDLEGAASGSAPNRDIICRIKKETGLFCEAGGGIRDMEAVDHYIRQGIDRVILGSAAVTDPSFLEEALKKYGDRIAVGVDLREGKVAIHGWKETSDRDADEFCAYLRSIGVRTVICTDISRDGAMRGTNLDLYRELSGKYSINFIASGGVTSLDDVRALKEMGIYGAIIGKAYYTGAIRLREALEAAE